jgi:hypothetical protein
MVMIAGLASAMCKIQWLEDKYWLTQQIYFSGTYYTAESLYELLWDLNQKSEIMGQNEIVWDMSQIQVK